MEEKTKSNNKKIFIGIFVIVFLILGYFLFFGKSTTGNAIGSDSIQKITLSMKGNYSPNTINVKSGVPVEITLDSSVSGCYRSFNIPELGISKYSSSPSDTITFTPNQKGTFRFQCSMGMGTGTIIVE